MTPKATQGCKVVSSHSTGESVSRAAFTAEWSALLPFAPRCRRSNGRRADRQGLDLDGAQTTVVDLAAGRGQHQGLPVDGFYGWQKRPAGRKQPYAIVNADGKPFATVGLWENWKEPQSGETVRTFTITAGHTKDNV
ncbi:MAG: SOS response-associated peptidase family protein [Alphaproteobacteria bacterium]